MQPMLRETKTVLVLTGDLGDGHIQAAEALQHAARQFRPDVRMEMRDFVSWTRPVLHTFSRFIYVQSVKRSPTLYGYVFEKTRQPNRLTEWMRRFRLVGLPRLAFMLKERRPDVIVSTFPLASASVSLVKSAGLLDIPLVTVITDYTDHSYWLHPCTDRYIVGSERVRHRLMGMGVPAERIAVTGIPVHPKFSFTFSKTALRTKYGLRADTPTVIVMGGGYGLISRDVTDLFRDDSLGGPLQVLIVCGRNKRLRRRLLTDLADSPHDVRIMGYVSDIHELMALSDLLITKSGGLTTTEAVTLELPMLLYKPIPGQETDNAEFLTTAGAALEARDAEELAALVKDMLRRPDRLEAMWAAARRLQMKYSAFKAVEAIVEDFPPDNRYAPEWADGSAGREMLV